MAKLDTISISFREKEYLVAIIPDIIRRSNQKILIGSHSLNEALYNDDLGYVNEDARHLDEQIYAYIDDCYMNLSMKEFLTKVNFFLD